MLQAAGKGWWMKVSQTLTGQVLVLVWVPQQDLHAGSWFGRGSQETLVAGGGKLEKRQPIKQVAPGHLGLWPAGVLWEQGAGVGLFPAPWGEEVGYLPTNLQEAPEVVGGWNRSPSHGCLGRCFCLTGGGSARCCYRIASAGVPPSAPDGTQDHRLCPFSQAPQKPPNRSLYDSREPAETYSRQDGD